MGDNKVEITRNKTKKKEKNFGRGVGPGGQGRTRERAAARPVKLPGPASGAALAEGGGGVPRRAYRLRPALARDVTFKNPALRQAFTISQGKARAIFGAIV